MIGRHLRARSIVPRLVAALGMAPAPIVRASSIRSTRLHGRADARPIAAIRDDRLVAARAGNPVGTWSILLAAT